MNFTQHKLREIVSGGNVGHHLQAKKGMIYGIVTILISIIGFSFSSLSPYLSKFNLLNKFSIPIIVALLIGLCIALVKLLQFDTKQELFLNVHNDHLIIKGKKYSDKIDKKTIKAMLPYSMENPQKKSIIAPINTGMRIFFNNMAPNYEFTMNIESLDDLVHDLEKKEYPVINNIEKISKVQKKLKEHNKFTKKIILFFTITVAILIIASMVFVIYYSSVQK